MPDLAHSLRDHDLEHLTNIAELWGIELDVPDVQAGISQLTKAILSADLVQEVFTTLAEEAQQALAAMIPAAGRLPWAQFTRQYGELRAMGPGRRSRQKPHRSPQSIAEVLWYRAIIARAFFDTLGGPQEFAYIPEDLLALLPQHAAPAKSFFGRKALKEERAKTILADDQILDHACVILAAKRRASTPQESAALSSDVGASFEFLYRLLTVVQILDLGGKPQSKPTRTFLEADRASALSQLSQAWLRSSELDDLRMLPHLEVEGNWDNDPLRARQIVAEFLQKVPEKGWWSISAFINDIYQFQPDFQRPTGDYDSWYLKDARTGEYLRGFAHWHTVDGELIRFLIIGPLHWLGILDLATGSDGDPPTAFRFSSRGRSILSGEKSTHKSKENAKLNIDSKGHITIPPMFPRRAHYQIGRFCEYISEAAGDYTYHITPASLASAQAQGLTISQLITLLRNHAAVPLPPNLLKAIQRWDQHGTQARIENVVVLRVASPEILKELQSSRAARFLGDPIGPTTIQVNPGAWEKVLGALAELGYLAQFGFDKGE